MSNALAIATITAVLETRLQTLLSNNGLNGFDVTPEHPGNSPNPGVYLQLYRIFPNPSGYNQDLPSRRSRDASIISRPQLSLDLNYLLTFIGDANNYDTERLAGLVMTELHTRPLLSPAEISNYLASLDNGDVLRDSNLAEQPNPVRLTLLPQTPEDMTRIWGLLNQSYYGLSVTYQVGPVMLEQDLQPTTPLPIVRPALQVFPLTSPRIDNLRTEDLDQSLVEIGQSLLIQGSSLVGLNPRVRLGTQLIEIPTENLRTDQITLPITPALGLEAGPISLQVIHQVQVRDTPAVEYRIAAESNTAVFALLPAITLVSSNLNAVDDPMTLSLTVEPTPSPSQPVELLLDEVAENGQHRVETQWELVDSNMVFTLGALSIGSWVVRLRVNGVLSRVQQDLGSGTLTPTVTVS